MPQDRSGIRGIFAAENENVRTEQEVLLLTWNEHLSSGRDSGLDLSAGSQGGSDEPKQQPIRNTAPTGVQQQGVPKHSLSIALLHPLSSPEGLRHVLRRLCGKRQRRV